MSKKNKLEYSLTVAMTMDAFLKAYDLLAKVAFASDDIVRFQNEAWDFVGDHGALLVLVNEHMEGELDADGEDHG